MNIVCFHMKDNLPAGQLCICQNLYNCTPPSVNPNINYIKMYRYWLINLINVAKKDVNNRRNWARKEGYEN